ncbi:hypothetical protein AB0D63_45175, partial [Kitasatospora sp. NPDC048343]|uniref:hypothetical protein n=1 Tax=Kitasatospora sp. NPDC048343 TaxID=3154717 RepID=UPI003409C20E
VGTSQDVGAKRRKDQVTAPRGVGFVDGIDQCALAARHGHRLPWTHGICVCCRSGEQEPADRAAPGQYSKYVDGSHNASLDV